MSEKSVTQCDICDKVKGATNHWWKASMSAEAPASIILTPFSEVGGWKNGAKTFTVDLCERRCVHSWIDAQMDAVEVRIRRDDATAT